MKSPTIEASRVALRELREGLHSVPGAAKFLETSEDYLWRQIRANRIATIRLGRLVRISDAELKRIASEGL